MTGLSDDLFRRAAEKLRSARHAVVLTGAGISTPSGIPDFRSPGTGEWARVDPLEVISLTTFRRQPERFYAWLRPLLGWYVRQQSRRQMRQYVLAPIKRAAEAKRVR